MDHYTGTGASRGFREESMDDEHGGELQKVASTTNCWLNYLRKTISEGMYVMVSIHILQGTQQKTEMCRISLVVDDETNQHNS